MPTVLFWNIKQRDLTDAVAALTIEHDVDVLILAECEIPAVRLLNRLNESSVQYVLAPSVVESDLVTYIRYSSEFLKPLYDDDHIAVKALALPASPAIIIAAVHFPSRLYFDEDDQMAAAIDMNATIRMIEREQGHERTIVVGDLNMNPFSPGMTFASGFNAVMTRSIAEKGSRRVQRKEHPFFFNPMWSQFHDGQDGPAGTFYMNPKGFASVYWHMIDQVLVRPALLTNFRSGDVKIVTETKTSSLLRRGRPHTSDHLPIKFKLAW